MRYENVVQGRFLSRPNRFIALVELDGAETVCHVKNTGRCRELLVPGAEVYLVPGVTPGRRTPYDLVAVNKGGRLINMDAQAPNQAFAEFARTFDPQAESIRPEFRFGESRLDFCLTRPDGLHLVEVKGVTLEQIKATPLQLKEHYSQKMQELVTQIKTQCNNLQTDFVQADINKGFDQVLLPYLLKRSRLK